MEKKENTIDLGKLKITSGLSLIGILVGFGFTIGINVNSFNNMKEQFTRLADKMDGLEERIDDKFDQQTSEFNQEISEVRDSNARMEGRLEAYFNYREDVR